MRRRDFVIGITAGTAANFAMPARPQNRLLPPKRIALVHPNAKPEELAINGRRAYHAFFVALNTAGYVEGQNLTVERYSAFGQIEHYEDVVRAAVASEPDLIICTGGTLARILKPLTATVSVVIVTPDPVALGIVTSLAKPDRNITGVSVDAGPEIWGKRLAYLRETTHTLTKVRILFPALVKYFWEISLRASLLEAAAQMNIDLSPAFLDGNLGEQAYERVFDSMKAEAVDGLIIGDSPEHVTNRQFIVDLAARYRLPTIYSSREFVDAGGLLSYGTDLADLYGRVAGVAVEVMRGTKPGDIPFYRQTKFELALNQRAAKSLGLEFPATLLAAADEVIE